MNRKWPAMNPPKWPTKNGAANKAAHFPTTASLITFQNPITALSAQKRTITSPSFQSRKSTPAREIRFAPIRARVEGDVIEGGGSWRTGEAAVRTGEGALGVGGAGPAGRGGGRGGGGERRDWIFRLPRRGRRGGPPAGLPRSAFP